MGQRWKFINFRLVSFQTLPSRNLKKKSVVLPHSRSNSYKLLTEISIDLLVENSQARPPSTQMEHPFSHWTKRFSGAANLQRSQHQDLAKPISQVPCNMLVLWKTMSFPLASLIINICVLISGHVVLYAKIFTSAILFVFLWELGQGNFIACFYSLCNNGWMVSFLGAAFHGR